MSRTSSVRRSARYALVVAGVAGAVVLSGGAAMADGPSASPAPVTRTPAASAAPTAPTSAPPATKIPASPVPSVTAPGAAPARPVPRGGAQTGEAERGGSPTAVLLGGAVALAGVAGVGTAVVRRRAGARG
ncbi:hypothetical protein [Kitasatospora sp. NBC_01539]|uniref:hypothetical protein n=1 Tax=Kitasatospora sp. NBC_01539 TaxID=2903577 RepID=UPI0038600933